MKKKTRYFTVSLGFLFSILALLGCAQSSNNMLVFECERLGIVEVQFNETQGIANVAIHKDTLVLPRQPIASGFYYSNGKTSIRGKGQTLSIEIGRMRPVQCRSKT
ncbi:MliC family protein [Paraglaciecola sp. 2405UD69-4]|uniref:MliC family protein n=1 Tax=Paraglaciecola sp. 2405UD69-4 TaxID=3391836 RepID=UPI0039C8C0A1